MYIACSIAFSSSVTSTKPYFFSNADPLVPRIAFSDRASNESKSPMERPGPTLDVGHQHVK